MARNFVELDLSESDVARWWSRVTPAGPDECWTWNGPHHSQTGYARMWAAGNSRPAHRVGYVIHHGPIGPGLVVDHLCRNRWCVNPAHLEPVTDRENLLRGVGVGAKNAAKDVCCKGHPYDAPLTPNKPRRCRTCRIESDRRYHARKRAAASR